MRAPSSKRVVRRSETYVDRTVEDPEGKMQQVRVNLSESPLSWLRARGHVNERLFLAGERLRQDWEQAGLGARVTMVWDGAPLSRGRRAAPAVHEPHGRGHSARQRLHEALDRAGPGLRDILWRVVCAGEGLSAAEQALGWPNRAAKLVLLFALERVADYYRVPGA